MSHFTVVIATSTPEEVERVLAPYDEDLEVPHTEYIEPDELERARKFYADGVDRTDDLAVLRNYLETDVKVEDGPSGIKLYSYTSTRNPNSKWDWYQIGGRWGGFFRLKPGELARPADASEYEFENRLNGFPVPELQGKADQARKRQIDFEAMRGEAIVKAHGEYDQFEAATRGIELPRRWSVVLDLYGEQQIDLAREVYRKQPFIRALHSNRIGPFSGEPLDHWCVNDGGRDAYAQRAGDSSGVPFAMVADGVWRERGRMGWFGHAADEMDGEDWNSLVRRIYDQLPDGALLTCVDCHI